MSRGLATSFGELALNGYERWRTQSGIPDSIGQILIRQSDGSWREPVLAGYAVEMELQGILAEHPELIPGFSAGASTCREFQSAAAPADIVVVDSNGVVTLVE